MNRLSIASVALVASALVGMPIGTVEARIACEGNFQIVQGRPIATPYCQEQNLARVARSYGMNVSFAAIRNSDSVKAQVCRTIGHDNRVRDTCMPFRIDGGPYRRW